MTEKPEPMGFVEMLDRGLICWKCGCPHDDGQAPGYRRICLACVYAQNETDRLPPVMHL